MAADNRLWLPLGELLVERGLLSERQLELALAEHNRSGRRLGEVLIGYGFVSQEALTSTLLRQVGGLTSDEPEADVVEEEQAVEPVVVRLDSEEEVDRRRWWSRGSGDERVAELERALEDFERRSREIQSNIVEIRATLRAIHDGR